jgi:hypothetical protein
LQRPRVRIFKIPVDFPPNLVSKYKGWNEEYIPATPIKKDEATLVMKILLMDIRFILRCGLEWDALVEADPVASGGLAASSQSAPAPGNDDAARQDRSRSASLAADPNDFKTWSITEIETI